MKLVWDASALVSLAMMDDANHQAAYEVWEEHRSTVSIFPALAWFEFQATVSKLSQSRGRLRSRELYILNEKDILLPLDQEFLKQCTDQKLADQFPTLRGADLVYAYAAHLTCASLVTFDKGMRKGAVGIICLPEHA